MKLLKRFMLKEEAHLFDTKIFLVKVFVAVLMANLVGKENTFLSKDMISMLFAMMLTLEPLNIAGLRSGIKQIEASIIGALITGAIMYFFGYNAVTIALAITATVYVCLLISWKEVMVVAMFTSIYMTQYVQMNSEGLPSVLLTFELRIAAISAGILIAAIVNLIFSQLGYKKMLEKRLYFIVKELSTRMSKLEEHVELQAFDKIEELMMALPDLFNSIDWIRNTISDSLKEQHIFRWSYRTTETGTLLEIANLLRDGTHLNYDLCYQLRRNPIIDVHLFEDYHILARNLENLRILLENQLKKYTKGRSENYLELIYGDTLAVQELDECFRKIYHLYEIYE